MTITPPCPGCGPHIHGELDASLLCATCKASLAVTVADHAAGHTPKNEREFLQGEIAAAREFLAELPPTHLVERMGFASRLREAESKLAFLRIAERAAPRSTPPPAPPPDDAMAIEIARLESLLTGTTDGPWEDKDFDGDQRTVLGPRYDGGKRTLVTVVVNHRANAAFVAASRTAVPTLIAEIRRLRSIELQRDALLGVLRLVAQGPCLCGPPSDPPEPPSCPSCWVRHEIDRDVPVGSTATLEAMRRDLRRLREERDHYRDKLLGLKP